MEKRLACCENVFKTTKAKQQKQAEGAESRVTATNWE